MPKQYLAARGYLNLLWEAQPVLRAQKGLNALKFNCPLKTKKPVNKQAFVASLLLLIKHYPVQSNRVHKPDK